MIQRLLLGEPVLVGGVTTAALTLAVAFGLDISGEQLAAVTALVVAVVTLIQRSQVTPVRREP